ncbi:MAG: sulfite exporter TauE/SafE family protein [Myxococcales bacterium]|nr:sulfite exporter TauE/SafE family protein [Myxococcales bacterium]MCB9715697.1 sulfite exporter TauE/SafE family protein [Myxococcales bacterium]
MPSSELLVLGLVALLSCGLSYLGASVGLVFGQLRLPILVYWLGSPAVGAATSLAISAVAALVGAARHARGGRVELRLMLTIGLPSAAAAWASTQVAPGLDPALVKLCIGATLVITGLVMLWAIVRPPRRAEASEPEPASASRASVTVERRPHLLAEIGVGASLGAAAGVVGLLLGTLRLPAMMRLGVHPAKVVGTNLAIGAATGLFAGVAALVDGTVDPWAFAVITPATMLGAYLGASATGRLDKNTLRRLIAWSLLGVGLWMAAEPWW